MSNVMRKGSLLLVLAAICAATLVWSPARSYAAGATSWTDDSPGGGTIYGDPDKPDPTKRFGAVSGRPALSATPRQTLSVGESYTVSSVTLSGWMQLLYAALRLPVSWF
jgi:hypothetical protein